MYPRSERTTRSSAVRRRVGLPASGWIPEAEPRNIRSLDLISFSPARVCARRHRNPQLGGGLPRGHATTTRKLPEFHLNFQVAGIGQRNRRLPRPCGGAGLRAGGVLDAFLGEGGLGRAVQLFLLGGAVAGGFRVLFAFWHETVQGGAGPLLFSPVVPSAPAPP